MKICLVNLGALPALSEEHKHGRIGGEEVQHAQLAMALSRLGHEVRLVVADCGQPDGTVYNGVTTLKAFNEADGIPVIRFVYPRWVKLWAALRRADSEVYYCSCAGMHVGMLAMFCRLHGKRLVFRTAIDSDCEPDQLIIQHARDRALYHYGLRRVDAILVQTLTQQRALAKNYGLRGTIADMLVARPTGAVAQPNKPIDVLWISNLRQIKRPDRLLEIATSLPHRRFHMAGGLVAGEESLFEQIRSAAGNISNLTFHGAVPYLDVGALFDRATVFANTSDMEGFPNTFLQAWVRGVPVVTMFDPDGQVQRFGLGSSHKSVAEMADGLEHLLVDRAAYRAASESAVTFMEERFGDAKVLAPYLEAFSGAMEGVNVPA